MRLFSEKTNSVSKKQGNGLIRKRLVGRKSVILLALCMVLFFLIAGCSSSGKNSGSTSTNKTSNASSVTQSVASSVSVASSSSESNSNTQESSTAVQQQSEPSSSVQQQPKSSADKGTQSQSANNAAVSVQQQVDNKEPVSNTYILNKSSKVFHYPSCPSVSKMKDKNKETFDGSREEAIAKGYKPCGNCKP